MSKPKTKIYPGLKIHRFTLLERKLDSNGKQIGWLCLCDCGNKKLIKNIGSVVNGASTSCGCYKNEYLKKNNPMFKKEVKEKMSAIMKAKPEQMENIKKAVIAAQTPEIKEKRKATNLAKYGYTSPSMSPTIIEKNKNTNIVRYGCIAPAQNLEVQKKIEKTVFDKYGTTCVLQNETIKKKIKKTNLERYGVDNLWKLKEVREAWLEKLKVQYGITTEISNVMQIPEIRKRAFMKKGMTKPERKFSEMLINNNIIFDYEQTCGESGKLWDFIIYNKDMIPIMVVEIDGEYVHGLISDPNGEKCGGISDHLRFLKIPEGVKYIQFDSLKINEGFQEVMKIMGMDYEAYIKNMVDECFNMSFPYPVESEQKMKNSYKQLVQFDKIPKKGNLLGNSLILNFHRSIWKCKKKGKKSPYEAWGNKKMLERCIRNRYIYKGADNLSSMQILRGFTVASIAPKVSVFMPVIAKYILKKYAPESSTVLDPFSGFSGRMLGTASLGMEYTGYDIRKEAIKESKEMANFLGLNVKLYPADIENVLDPNQYDALITCPPYGNLEIWMDNQDCKDEDYYIDLCLKKFKCKKYIFIVKDTKKYKNCIKESITWDSHLSKNTEHVVVINSPTMI